MNTENKGDVWPSTQCFLHFGSSHVAAICYFVREYCVHVCCVDRIESLITHCFVAIKGILKTKTGLGAHFLCP